MADGASVSALSTIKLHIEARDCDGLPIRYTRADIQFSFNNQLIAVTWNRGSNKYTAVVPTEVTAQPGVYALVVTASKAWNKTAGQTTRCELLRRNVRIDSVATTVGMQYIILGVLLGLAILALGALLGCQVRAHKDKAKLFVESFFKHEGQLAVKICWDAWVRRARTLCHALEHAACARSSSMLAGYRRRRCANHHYSFYTLCVCCSSALTVPVLCSLRLFQPVYS
jgi:hypothetical protein